jgi:hypothetical protein
VKVPRNLTPSRLAKEDRLAGVVVGPLGALSDTLNDTRSVHRLTEPSLS